HIDGIEVRRRTARRQWPGNDSAVQALEGREPVNQRPEDKQQKNEDRPEQWPSTASARNRSRRERGLDGIWNRILERIEPRRLGPIETPEAQHRPTVDDMEVAVGGNDERGAQRLPQIAQPRIGTGADKLLR